MTLITWQVYGYDRQGHASYEPRLAKVHKLREEVVSSGSKTKDRQLLAGKTTICGRSIDLWSEPYIVKSTLNRPCKQCGLEARRGPTEKGVHKTMKINLSNVSTTFEPRKAGEYEGTLVGHVLNSASATSGQPTLRLEWVEKDDPSSHMFKTYSLQPKALWSLKRDLLRVGASVEAMNDPEADIEEIVRSLYGYVSTIKYGDPRPDANDPTKLYDNFLEIVDPKKLS